MKNGGWIMTPSLVVDLAPFGINQKDQVKPVHLCSAINQGLRNISPPQVELAAIRWTAKGNLVVTGGPTSTPHTLQLAAPHISNIISTTLSLPSNHTLAQPWANVKWSKILINGVPTRASLSRLTSLYARRMGVTMKKRIKM